MTVVLRESRNIFSDNPIVFMLDLQDALVEGYRVENTIAGFPTLNAILKEVRVFKPITADLERAQKHTTTEITVSNYDSMRFLLDVQDAMLDGYEVDREMVRFDNPKVCRLIKTLEIREEEFTDIVQEEVLTEKPKAKPGRKPKPKQEV
ncbi:hypothetical protein D3C85_860850 [compost metagenome]